MSGIPAKRLGVDFGRVIMGGDGPEDTPFLSGTVDKAIECPSIPGAIEALTVLTQRFDGRVWIVSKAGPGVQRKTLSWLEHNKFWERTGITPWSICFVLDREAKATVARKLKLTHFIDDRVDCLHPMIGLVENLYQFGVTEVANWSPEVKPLPDWSDISMI